MGLRVLMVEPGPAFSVADVHRGWQRAFAELGCAVANVNLADRLDLYTQAHIPRDGQMIRAFNDDAAVHLAAKGIESAAFEFWPHVVILTSAFFVPPVVIQLLRERRMTVVLLCTEEPYEATREMGRAAMVDACVVNDPTHLESFRSVTPNTWYLPAAYDPSVHCPGPGVADLACDFTFVGTGFDSRVEFFEQVDWSGLDVTFAGNWKETDPDSPLRKFVVHDLNDCCSNDQAVDLYRSAKLSANLYRKEAQAPGLEQGWAMSPREVELAATGCFFLREPRPEGDEILPMLPHVEPADGFGDQIRWWASHDAQRQNAADAARAAVADRTFINNAKTLLRHLAV